MHFGRSVGVQHDYAEWYITVLLGPCMSFRYQMPVLAAHVSPTVSATYLMRTQQAAMYTNFQHMSQRPSCAAKGNFQCHTDKNKREQHAGVIQAQPPQLFSEAVLASLVVLHIGQHT